MVKPETVIRRHRCGFQAYWHWRSLRRGGRPTIDCDISALIPRMSCENPLWGEPRIHGELLMLGVEVAQSTVAKVHGPAKSTDLAGLEDIPAQPRHMIEAFLTN